MKKLLALFAFIPFTAFAADDCAELKFVPDTVLSLSDVIDLGLCRNPQTAAAHAALRAQRFNKNAAYHTYLPSAEFTVFNGSKKYAMEHWSDSYGASLSASYLLFDFR